MAFEEAVREGFQESEENVTGVKGSLLGGGRRFPNTLPVVMRKVENVCDEAEWSS